ncbi:MAG: PAS domain S-box protein [Pseudomonadota bacterium]
MAPPYSPSASARLAALVDSAMDAIITADGSQRIVMYNRAAEKIFGWPPAEVMGEPLTKLVPQRFRAHHGEHVRTFGATGETSRRMGGSSIVYALRANGEEFPVDASISQLDTPEGKLFTVILRDATERIRAQQEQQRLTARLSGLLDSAMDGIITIDESQLITLYNPAAERIFGWTAAQVLGEPLTKLIPQRFEGSHAEHVRRFGATGVTSRRMGGSAVVYGRRSTGEDFPLDASISQLDTLEGKLYSVILRDVTERVRAQEELAAFAAEASHIREQEKTRVARELHDELAQSLTALKMDAMWLRDNLPADAAALAAKLDGMLAMLDGTVAATRRIAADLRPLMLDDLGLVPAIEWLAQNFTQRTGVPCALELDEALELGEPYATAVFRMVQESLANVAKHAQARSVRVGVAATRDEVTLWVIDDGVGFRADAPRKPNSLGHAGLRERAQLLKGAVRIDSTPGGGTRVEAKIPVKNIEADQ